jgi:ethanolamine utilization protein EutN
MKVCRVLGPVVASAKHPAFDGRTLLVVQPLDERGEADSGAPFIAVDHAQAGKGDRVLVLREGGGVRQVLGAPDLPIRSLIVGIVDAVEIEA